MPKLAIRDADGNLTNATASIQVSILSGTLVGSTSATAVAGEADFAGTGLGITGPAGTYTLQFTAVVGAETLRASSTVSIVAGPAAGINISAQPVNKKTGEDFPAGKPQVRLVDSSGNPTALSNSVTVRATVVSSVGRSSLSPNVVSGIVVFDENGIANFDQFDFAATLGSYRLVFNAGDFAPATSVPFELTLGDPTAISWQLPPPTSVATGTNFARTQLNILDSQGNIVTTDNSTVVTATVTAPVGATVTLSGNVRTASNGVFQWIGHQKCDCYHQRHRSSPCG
jgi:hypothetical protein